MDENSQTRVKLYKLNDEGEWDDWGTGQVAVGLQDSSPVIKVDSDQGEVLLNTRVVIEDIYKLQGETIITWKDDDKGSDLALSFQESEGCKATWELIQAAQKYKEVQAEDPLLPQPTLENVPELAERMENLPLESKRTVAADILRHPDYISKLLSVFTVVEDLEDRANCVLLYKIFNAMVGLVHPEIVKNLINNENFIQFFGVLEYDPQLRKDPEHRAFLKQAQFRQEIAIEDANVIELIQQNFRLQYLEHICPRVLDDPTTNMLHRMIIMNNQTIVSRLQLSQSYKDNLMAKASDMDLPLEKRIGALELLLELVKVADDSLQEDKIEFFRLLCDHKGFFPTLDKVLGQKNPSHREKTICARVLFYVLKNVRQPCRSFCINSQNHPKPPSAKGDVEYPHSFLMGIIKLLVKEHDIGIQADAAKSLHELFHRDFYFDDGEPDTLTPLQRKDKEACLSVLYEKYLEWMVKPFRDSIATLNKSDSPSTGPNKAMLHLCEFLGNCVLNHGYRAKYFVLKNDLMGTIVQLCHRNEKILQIASVQFLLACVQVKKKEAAPFYHRYIVKNDLFKPVFECFFKNPSDDMLKASICHLVDFIGSENFKVLVKYIATKYGARLQETKYCKAAFEQIQRKYEQNEDFEHNKDQFSKDAHGKQLSSAQIKYLESRREESYFDEDDGDDDPIAPATVADESASTKRPALGARSGEADTSGVDNDDQNPAKKRRV